MGNKTIINQQYYNRLSDCEELLDSWEVKLRTNENKWHIEIPTPEEINKVFIIFSIYGEIKQPQREQSKNDMPHEIELKKGILLASTAWSNAQNTELLLYYVDSVKKDKSKLYLARVNKEFIDPAFLLKIKESLSKELVSLKNHYKIEQGV